MSSPTPAEKNPGFWQNALVYLGGTVAVQGISFLSQPVFGFLMTPEEYGVVANYIFWMTGAGLLVSLQLHSTLNVARSTWGESAFPRYVAGLVPVYVTAGAALLAAVLLAPGWWSERLSLSTGYLMCAVANGVFFALGLLATAHAVTLGNRARYLWLSVGSVLGPVALGLVLVVTLPDAVEARVVGYLASSGLLLVVLVARVGRQPARPVHLGAALAVSVPLLVHELLSLVTNQSNRIFLLADAGAGPAGVFAFAFGLGSITTVAAVAVNSAWTPWFFTRSDAGDGVAVRRSATQLVWLFAMGAGAACLVSPDVLVLLTRPAFSDGALVMAAFVAIGHLGLVFNLATNHVVRHRRTGWVLATSVAACSVNVLLNVTLIPRWGIAGATVASVAAYIVLAVGAVSVVALVFDAHDLPLVQMLASCVVVLTLLGLTWLARDMLVVRWTTSALVLGLVGTAVLRRLRESERAGGPT